MTHPVLADALAQACRQIPGTLAAVCADLRSGDILASHAGDAPAAATDELAGLAARVLAGGRDAGLNRLWRAGADSVEGGDELVVLEPERCFVILRAVTRPHFALVFLTGRAADVGLTIARTRAVKASFEDALRQL